MYHVPIISKNQPCRLSMIISRLWIVHTLLTHRHILDKTDLPKCTDCDDRLTIEHFLITCPNSAKLRTRHDILPKILINNNNNEQLIRYFKKMKLYDWLPLKKKKKTNFALLTQLGKCFVTAFLPADPIKSHVLNFRRHYKLIIWLIRMLQI